MLLFQVLSTNVGCFCSRLLGNGCVTEPWKVSSRNIRSFVVQYLRSGHTHEDIDQTFGALSKHLLRVRDLQSPSDVVNTIKDFLQKAKMAWETERHVVMMDSIRDWSFAMSWTRIFVLASDPIFP